MPSLPDSGCVGLQHQVRGDATTLKSPNSSFRQGDSSACCIVVGPDRLAVNEAVLRRAWESSQRSTPEDWAEWARHFAVELLRNSPSPALRANYKLAEARISLCPPQHMNPDFPCSVHFIRC